MASTSSITSDPRLVIQVWLYEYNYITAALTPPNCLPALNRSVCHRSSNAHFKCMTPMVI